jgi:hypothetical protein
MKGIRFQRCDGEVNDPLLRPLFNDLLDCEDMFAKSDSQFVRRSFVRSSFAFIEGQLNWLRVQLIQWLTARPPQGIVSFAATLTLLQEEVPRPDRRGKLSNDSNRLPFLNHCAFVLRTAAEHAGADADSFFSDNGWNELQKSLDVRHRITHPKRPEELDVTDAEIDSMRESHRWFLKCIVEVINAFAANCHSTMQQSPKSCSGD